MPSRSPIALHSPYTLTLPPVTLVRFQVLLVLLLPGDQPNGIVGGRGGENPAQPHDSRHLCSVYHVPYLDAPDPDPAAPYLRPRTLAPRRVRRSSCSASSRPIRASRFAYLHYDDGRPHKSPAGRIVTPTTTREPGWVRGRGGEKPNEANIIPRRCATVRVRRLTTLRYYVIVKNSSATTTRVHENIDSSCRVRAYCDL